jgi:hypothetical protein
MKYTNLFIRFTVLSIFLTFSTAVFADVKIKSRQTMSGNSSEYTTYIKGKRQRTEQKMGEMETVSITQCDLKRSVKLMPVARTYMVDLWESTASVAPTTTTTKTQTTTEKGGVLTNTITTKDTGERKQMFGYTARHIITTVETDSSPDACTPMKNKMQTDGWYIDAAFALDCEMDRYKNYRPPVDEKSGCRDRYETKQIGTAKRGYPVYEKMTMFDQSGKETYSFVNEVVELSNTTLDAGLFDVPAGYREVKDSTELYASMSKGGNSASAANTDEDSSGNSAFGQNVKNMATKPAAQSTEVGAKKAGVVRVGMAAVKTGNVGDGMNATELAAQSATR